MEGIDRDEDSELSMIEERREERERDEMTENERKY